jgi:L-lactate dehydrogenase complex protein LldG
LGIVAEALPFEVADAAAARAKVAELFPAAKVVCSAVPEIPGTRRIETVRDPHELADVDVGVMRSRLGSRRRALSG